MRALISVSDKTGLLDFARALSRLGFELLSTGGTFKALHKAGLLVKEVSAHTGFPEIMDGRVKTLHPKIHGGLLGRRGQDDDVMEAHGIVPFDLLVLNLYPFEQTVAGQHTFDEAIENIDIGGPAMLRAAAKNFAHVGVVTSPDQYPKVLAELEAHGALGDTFRFGLAVAAFNAVSNYDAAISDYLSAIQTDGSKAAFPAQSNGRFVKVMDLRYGENPHQQAAFYRDLYPVAGSLATFKQHQGKELSYNNLADADAAWECVKSFPESPACVIVKHANPCGVAFGKDLSEAYTRAHATDPTSAFGGIIAFNQTVDAATMQKVIGNQFVEVLIAPSYTPEALAASAAKGNVRVLEIAFPQDLAASRNTLDVKRVGSGLLMQTADNHVLQDSDLKTVSHKAPTAQQWQDLRFAWRVAQYVKSNAIVYVKNGQTLGIGAGQMSRVDSARIAALKAAEAGLSLEGAVMASDAFFPFRDGIDAAASRAIAAVIHPGGSMRDAEVVSAADEHGMAMVLTGVRHFRH